MSVRTLLDEEGENLAVRSFLMQYSCDRALTIGAMRKHMDMSGWPLQYCPEFARIGDYDSQHLTKAGAQLWIRHLLSLEPRCTRQGGCVCGGDLPAVRAGCSWMEGGAA